MLLRHIRSKVQQRESLSQKNKTTKKKAAKVRQPTASATVKSYPLSIAYSGVTEMSYMVVYRISEPSKMRTLIFVSFELVWVKATALKDKQIEF